MKKCKACALQGKEIEGCIFYDCPNKNKDGRKNNGGSGRGQGRKPAPYQTTTIAFRVRTDWVEPVKEAVKKEVTRLKKTNATMLQK